MEAPRPLGEVESPQSSPRMEGAEGSSPSMWGRGGEMSEFGPQWKKLYLWAQLSCASGLGLVILLLGSLFLWSVAVTLGHFYFFPSVAQNLFQHLEAW